MIIDFSDTRETTKMPHENNAWEQRSDREKCIYSHINQSVLNTTQFHRRRARTRKRFKTKIILFIDAIE